MKYIAKSILAAAVLIWSTAIPAAQAHNNNIYPYDIYIERTGAYVLQLDKDSGKINMEIVEGNYPDTEWRIYSALPAVKAQVEALDNIVDVCIYSHNIIAVSEDGDVHVVGNELRPDGMGISINEIANIAGSWSGIKSINCQHYSSWLLVGVGFDGTLHYAHRPSAILPPPFTAIIPQDDAAEEKILLYPEDDYGYCTAPGFRRQCRVRCQDDISEDNICQKCDTCQARGLMD